jgi:hypothetical protein
LELLVVSTGCEKTGKSAESHGDGADEIASQDLDKIEIHLGLMCLLYVDDPQQVDFLATFK